jgi:pimeloyl-ACP methyl ester carboxylesterase
MARHQLSRGNYTLACEDFGQGPPVVLLHGFPLHGGMWDAQRDFLCPNYRVIVPDLRGFGDSGLDAGDVEAGVGMADYAGDVMAQLDALQVTEPVVLAGFSMGGYVAWQIALNHPRRLRALIPCDTRAAADTPEARAGRLAMAHETLSRQSSELALAMVPKLLAEGTRANRPELVRRTEAMISRSSAPGIAAAQRGMASRPDVGPRLGEIHCPVLCLGGAEDAISPPAEMSAIAAAVPRGEWVEIPSAGHLAPWENELAVNAAVGDFLDRIRSAG